MIIPIIYGKRLYGKVDHGANRLYIATQFFHVWFFPLFPLRSFIVFEEDKNSENPRGIQVGLNIKSILATYVRLGCSVTGIAFTLTALLMITVSGYDALFLLALGIGSWLIVALSYELFRASSKNAQKLAQRAGILPVENAQYNWEGEMSRGSTREENWSKYSTASKDCYSKVTITSQEARTGTQVELKLDHLPGKIKVKIPAGISSGSKLRFSGLGMPGSQGEPAGNLYVEVEIRSRSLMW